MSVAVLLLRSPSLLILKGMEEIGPIGHKVLLYFREQPAFMSLHK